MKFVVKMIWIVSFCILPVCAWAQWTSVYETGQENNFGMGFQVSHSSMNDTTKNMNGVSVDYQFDDVPGVGIHMLYTFNDIFALTVNLDTIMNSSVHIKTAGTKAKIGELSTLPLTLSARFYLPTDTIFKPYLGAGFGYYFNSFDSSVSDVDIDDAFGFHYTFGADLWINRLENTALNIDIKYLKPDTENDHLDWDAWNIGIGLIYFFK
ncbi:MAG: outer membrane beta-barrel protein [Candidatus Magnetomorum sp.]|nr:outer membrane beta-barrel protein [Candidatus Magnetomorum sp.]